MNVSIPRLTTERLLLRELRSNDFDAYATFAADPRAMEFMSGVLDRRNAWRAFSSMTGAWNLTGAGWWAVELATTGELVGMVGGFFRETEFDRGAEAVLELGWTIFPAFWRRGYASEAAKAALACSFDRHPVRRVVAVVDPGNVASIGVCKSIGMTLDGEIDFYGEPAIRYAIDRP